MMMVLGGGTTQNMIENHAKLQGCTNRGAKEWPVYSGRDAHTLMRTVGASRILGQLDQGHQTLTVTRSLTFVCLMI